MNILANLNQLFGFSLDSKKAEALFDAVASFGFRLVAVLIILVIGSFIISKINKVIKGAFKKSSIDPTISTFLESFINISLRILLIVMTVVQLGFVKEGSLIALLGTVGLAIGLALQGSLSNFAGGIMILFLKPYKVGDFIEVQNFNGKIEKIQVFHSRLLTPDNKVVIVPNGTLINSIIINHSAKPTRRVDLAFNVSYESDIIEVQRLLTEMLEKHPKILKEPTPFLRLTAQAASSLTFTSRSWVNTDDYWEVYFDLMEQSKHILDDAGIEIPYNKMDINFFERKVEK